MKEELHKDFVTGDTIIVKKNDDGSVLREDIREHRDVSNMNEMGYYGNIWVRSHYFAKAGDANGGGHRHHFDHVTLLAVGSVTVEVEDAPPKDFHAPTFIVIDKNKKHKFTALTDGVVYYCVFALRDVDGEVTDIYSTDNSPYSAVLEADHIKRTKLQELDAKTHTEE
jgi:hypothetical protein